jgi:uncharacterized membrane protein
MKRIRVIHWLLYFVLFFGIVAGIAGGQTAVVAEESGDSASLPALSQEEPPPEDKIELQSRYPVLKEKSGRLFEFQVELHYQGSKDRVFNFFLEAPPGTYTNIVAPYSMQEKGIEAILLEPGQEYPETVNIQFNPSIKGQAEPGEYPITLQVASGDISSSIELTAVVTARYELFINTSTRRLNAEITAGRDNHIGIWVKNAGSVALEKLRFSVNVPEGWGLEVTPEVLDSLGPELVQEADMVITPPSNTIAGDYEIRVRAITDEIVSDMTLRITVETPTIWGWVGILIVVAVIAGLAVIFVLLGRR